jgi:N5-(carboxyethyl)ornithine synthase
MNTPLYTQDQINHYVIDHTPSLLYRTASKSISQAILPFLDDLIFKTENEVLSKATIIENGKIIVSDILDFQSKKINFNYI